MDAIFFIKLAFSFIIGGSWVVLATVLGDKLGSRIGGLVSGLPSTVMFGLFFLGWTQTPHVAVSATTIIPIVGGINCLFLVTYVYLVKRGLWQSIFAGFSLWGLLSFILIWIQFDNFILSLVAYVILFLASFYIIDHVLNIQATKGKRVIYTPITVLLRALLGGGVVVFSVFLGKIGGPIFGGMFSMFPAMFTSTILITYMTHGAAFSAGTMKSSLVSAISVVLYSVVSRYSFEPLGLVFGTILSICTSFGFGFLLYQTVIRKLS